MSDLHIADFALPATGNTTFKLSDQRGKNVVVYFYPKDNTPGCTVEGQEFRDLHADFEQAGTVVVGVSRDSLKSHEGFKSKQGFPFELLSDTEGTLCERFGVMKQKNMYGKLVRGIERSTFVFDKTGKLVKEWRGLKAPGHAAEVLAFVQTL
ncbi:MAG: peroxiredoxin [Hydrogenophilales bacterium 16-64-46]|nr:MAG: peroxiredoxin [Hydrogenophilales bacterium 12-64-13]OYZ06362.1 MAG: peroxiredoxin [Hydrogenophilales bacterium 16-64-46]OZA38739.1 MAG: peroxiredoxin [Hydrogenophilales bacterium 17-64-34]HQS99640.1 peroxiredoxin [Thiobacillus sp.]